MVVLLVSVCVVEAGLLIGFGLYAEFLELRKRQGHHPAAGHAAMGSPRH
jgi:hypothetical protein